MVETFRFEDENDCDEEICLEFFTSSQKVDTPESFHQKSLHCYLC